MAKIVIQHDVDPGIAVLIEEVLEGTPDRARGFYGTCTECGRRTHKWSQTLAVNTAVNHVDAHESGL